MRSSHSKDEDPSSRSVYLKMPRKTMRHLHLEVPRPCHKVPTPTEHLDKNDTSQRYTLPNSHQKMHATIRDGIRTQLILPVGHLIKYAKNEYFFGNLSLTSRIRDKTMLIVRPCHLAPVALAGIDIFHDFPRFHY